jgi:Ran GTPase-activating protein (RanGAP) involved in mRNA processing and transport
VPGTGRELADADAIDAIPGGEGERNVVAEVDEADEADQDAEEDADYEGGEEEEDDASRLYEYADHPAMFEILIESAALRLCTSHADAADSPMSNPMKRQRTHQ